MNLFPRQNKHDAITLTPYVWLLKFAWTTVILASLFWSFHHANVHMLEMAKNHARTAYQKDVIYRKWNARLGGVYAEVSEQLRPNKYLDFLPERDVITPSNRKLTLINPAYMTRMIHELAQKEEGVLGHITSLKPIRPENAPDIWEREALLDFEQGEKEVSALQTIAGVEYMRLMRPLYVEKPCLKCHVQQGHEEGDLRGGISVSVPIDSLREMAHHEKIIRAIEYCILWVFGIIGILLGGRRLIKGEGERAVIREKERKLMEDLALVNKDLTNYDYVVSHDLKAPLRSIGILARWLCDDYSDKFDEDGKEKVNMLVERVKKMQTLIDSILRYSKIGRVNEAMEAVDINQLIKETLELMGLPDHVLVTVQENMPVLVCVRTQIEQVFENLLSNAVKYCHKPKCEISIDCVEEQDFFTFKVSDNGLGIEEKYFEDVFKIFKTLSVRSKEEETGIGLSVVHKILTQHGGNVWVESTVGKGSIFYFTLPKGKKE